MSSAWEIDDTSTISDATIMSDMR